MKWIIHVQVSVIVVHLFCTLPNTSGSSAQHKLFYTRGAECLLRPLRPLYTPIDKKILFIYESF